MVDPQKEIRNDDRKNAPSEEHKNEVIKKDIKSDQLITFNNDFKDKANVTAKVEKPLDKVIITKNKNDSFEKKDDQIDEPREKNKHKIKQVNEGKEKTRTCLECLGCHQQ